MTDIVKKVPEVTPELLEQNELEQRQWRERFKYEHPTRETYADRVIDDNLRIIDALHRDVRKANRSDRAMIRKRIADISNDTAIWAASRGQFELAARLTSREHEKRDYKAYQKAVSRSDDEWCEHPPFEYVDGELMQNQTREFDCPSESHAGTVSMLRCRICGFRNAAALPPVLAALSEHRRQVRSGAKQDVATIREAIGDNRS